LSRNLRQKICSITKKALPIWGALVLCITIVGCGTTYNTAFDEQWADGQLRTVIQTRHYSPPPFSFKITYSENSEKLTSEKWSEITVPLPNPSGKFLNKHEFLHRGGKPELEGSAQTFTLIRGTNLLIHRFLSEMWVLGTQQFTVFDPITGKDISNPFPPSPARCIFNRSGTICLTAVSGTPVIVDVLSAQTGNPKILAKPPWVGVFRRLEFERLRGFLTDDGQYLVLLPHIESSSYIKRSNFNAEVWSVNGNKEVWPIPLDRKDESFVDAEIVDGKVLILSRMMKNGDVNADSEGFKLINIQGKTVLSTNVPAARTGPIWDPSRNEILFSPFYIWNYKSNTMQRVSIPSMTGD
jgi:hypothetical protein